MRFMLPTSDEDFIRKVNQLFYDIESEDYNCRHPEVFQGDFEWWSKFGLNFIEKKRDLKILDIGSGTGFVAGVLLNYVEVNTRVVCYDLSCEMLKTARSNISASAKIDPSFVCGNDIILPFRNNYFDIVTLNAVFHHLPKCDSIAKEIYRLLKPKGIIAVSHEPNKLFLESRVTKLVASLYKFIGCGMTLTDKIQKDLNWKLRELRLIEHDLSKEEILKIVEFQSPFEQESVSIDKDKGFIPLEFIKNHFEHFNILTLDEYSTFYHRPLLEKYPVLKKLVKNIGSLFLGRGNLFSFVLEKCE